MARARQQRRPHPGTAGPVPSMRPRPRTEDDGELISRARHPRPVLEQPARLTTGRPRPLHPVQAAVPPHAARPAPPHAARPAPPQAAHPKPGGGSPARLGKPRPWPAPSWLAPSTPDVPSERGRDAFEAFIAATEHADPPRIVVRAYRAVRGGALLRSRRARRRTALAVLTTALAIVPVSTTLTPVAGATNPHAGGSERNGVS